MGRAVRVGLRGDGLRHLPDSYSPGCIGTAASLENAERVHHLYRAVRGRALVHVRRDGRKLRGSGSAGRRDVVGGSVMSDVAAELAVMSAEELSAKVRSEQLSAVEVARVFLQRIEERAAGNAFITTCPEYALRQAAKRPTGPLAGVPLAVKDTFDTAGVRTTYGSSIFRDHVPTKTAHAVAKLEAAGAIMVGKANQHELAWGVTSQNPHWGTVANPVLPGKVAGGSRGGTAAALADGLCTIALGTDTGGSVR